MTTPVVCADCRRGDQSRIKISSWMQSIALDPESGGCHPSFLHCSSHLRHPARRHHLAHRVILAQDLEVPVVREAMLGLGSTCLASLRKMRMCLTDAPTLTGSRTPCWRWMYKCLRCLEDDSMWSIPQTRP